MDQKITRAYLLADPDQSPLEIDQGDNGVSTSLPDQAPDPNASVICLELSNSTK